MWLVPVEDSNKTLDQLEKVVYRRQAQRITIIEMSISILVILFQWEQMANCLMLVLISMVIMLLFGIWNKWRDSVRKQS